MDESHLILQLENWWKKQIIEQILLSPAKFRTMEPLISILNVLAIELRCFPVRRYYFNKHIVVLLTDTHKRGISSQLAIKNKSQKHSILVVWTIFYVPLFFECFSPQGLDSVTS